MNSQDEHKEYVEQLRKMKIEVVQMLTNMNKPEMGSYHDLMEERELLDSTFGNEMKLHGIYKQLNELEKEVKEFAGQADYAGKERNKHGSKFKGGIKRHYTVTMPQQDWDIIDEMIEEGRFRYVSDYFRFLHRSFVKSQK